MAVGDPMRRSIGLRRRCELALGDEDLVLQPQKERPRGPVVGGELARGPAQVGPELVVRADGPDAGGVLPYAGAAQETGLAAVAGAGV